MNVAQKYLNPSILFLLLSLVFFLILASGAGISGDEDINYKFSGYVYDYFTGGPDAERALKKVRGPDYAYHYTYDLVVTVLDKIFDFDDIHQARHYWSGIIGWGAVVMVFLLGRKYFDESTGIIAGTLLMVSPRFLGHAINNTRDVPFAFGYMAAIFGILHFADHHKNPSWKSTALCALTIGLALNARIGGLILYPFLFLIVFIKIFLTRKTNILAKKHWPEYGKLVGHMVAVCAIAYASMLLFWPFGQQAPLTNPIESLSIMSEFAVGIRQLFEGNNISSLELPWYYTIKWISISTPVVFILGLLMSLGYLLKKRKRSRKVVYLALASFAMIPILYIIYKGSNVYGGWRHSIFIYPPLTLLAAIGLRYTYKLIKQPIASYAFLGIGGILALLPILHVIKNYPVHYVYFNEMAGGVKSAYGNYEMDYYMHSIKPGYDWLVDEGIVNDTDSLLLATNHRYSTQYYNRNRGNVDAFYTRYYERLKKEWDYAIYINVYIDQPEIRSGVFPPTGTIHTIDVDGKPVCAIVKNPSNAAVGYDVDMKAKNYNAVAKKLRAYYEADNQNFESTMNLAIAYQGLGRQDSLNFFLQKAKEINPQRFTLYTQPRK